MIYCRVKHASHDELDLPVVTSSQCSCNGGGVTVEEGTHVVDALVVGFSLNNREDLVWKIHSNLVCGECHNFYLRAPILDHLDVLFSNQ